VIRVLRSLLILLLAVPAFAQQANLNLEGFIRDEASGAPVGVKIFIWTPSGKRITITSNSKDGSYLQTLSEAGPHKVALTGYNIYRKEVTVDMPKSEKYRVIKQDFTVRTLQEGALIGTVQNGFEKNGATLTPAGQKQVQDAIELLRANQEMNIVFHIAPDEDRLKDVKAKADAAYQKELDAWKKAVKKTKKGQTPPAEPVRPADPADPNIDLVQQRINAVKALAKDVKAGDVRIAYVSVPLPVATPATPAQPATPAPAKKGKKGAKTSATPATPATPAAPSIPSLVVKVGKVKKLYD
jgi:hypothetical protein